jgi:hypothetical protein
VVVHKLQIFEPTVPGQNKSSHENRAVEGIACWPIARLPRIG